ncbi:MAG: sn-glycerol-1-phosphate dehydrogenase [Clostridia bacterium]|nr:sn-glycerol-1-phosphate dehydrogenase [Clostridia bacterium]
MDIKKLLKGISDCTCGKSHSCPIDYVDIADGAIDRIPDMCKNFKKILIVCDDNTYAACGKAVEAKLLDSTEKLLILKAQTDVVIPDETQIEEIDKCVTKDTDLILGVGSGVINDLCKYVSFKNNLPYYIVATAPSMDGYASVGSALILSGMKVTLNAAPPKAIIAEPAVLATAPTPMLQSGYGDIIGKYSCLNDWKLARIIKDEYFCDEVYDLTMSCVKEVEPLAKAVLARDTTAVGALMEALVAVGIAMAYVGNSRPASGSEHHLSHFFEITGILDNKEYFLHGIDVMYSAAVTCKLREMILKNGIEDTKQDRGDWTAEVRRIYSTSADECIALQNKVGFYAADDSAAVSSKKEEIKLVLKGCPDFDYMKSLLDAIELDFDAFIDMYGLDKIADAVLYGKDLKDRYTVLWLYYQFFKRG